MLARMRPALKIGAVRRAPSENTSAVRYGRGLMLADWRPALAERKNFGKRSVFVDPSSADRAVNSSRARLRSGRCSSNSLGRSAGNAGCEAEKAGDAGGAM